jgi:hypothetical protein
MVKYIALILLVVSTTVVADWSTYYDTTKGEYTASQSGRTSKGDWLRLIVSEQGEIYVKLANGYMIREFNMTVPTKTDTMIHDLMQNKTVTVRLGDRYAVIPLKGSSVAINQVTR